MKTEAEMHLFHTRTATSDAEWRVHVERTLEALVQADREAGEEVVYLVNLDARVPAKATHVVLSVEVLEELRARLAVLNGGGHG